MRQQSCQRPSGTSVGVSNFCTSTEVSHVVWDLCCRTIERSRPELFFGRSRRTINCSAKASFPIAATSINISFVSSSLSMWGVPTDFIPHKLSEDDTKEMFIELAAIRKDALDSSVNQLNIG